MPVLKPQSEAELAEMVRAARADGSTLEILGGGSKRALGRPVMHDTVLDLSGLSGVVSYEPGELVITLRAGTTLSELNAVIAGKRQRLGFDPADWGALFGTQTGVSTIGGALAADTSGTARVRFGAARDHLLGFRAVNGFGEIYKGGGAVVKNVTGFDLPKLMCGAFGTLGPLSEVTLRLLPRAVGSLTLAVRDIDPDRALTLLRRLWQQPLEASGLLYIPACAFDGFPMYGGTGAGVVLVRVEGGPAALAEKRSLIQSQLDGRMSVEAAGADAVFAHAASGAVFSDLSLDVWRLAVPPAVSRDVAGALAGTLWLADWAGAMFWIGTSGDAISAAATLRRISGRAQGALQLVRASEDERAKLCVFPPQSEGLFALSRSVKAAFDPSGLFNSGRMYEGL